MNAFHLAGQPLAEHGLRLSPGWPSQPRVLKSLLHLQAQQLDQRPQPGAGPHELAGDLAQQLVVLLCALGYGKLLPAQQLLQGTGTT